MVPDLKRRIVDLVDRAAPPIDVAELAERLDAADGRPVRRHRDRVFRRPAWAFALAFVGMLLAVGGALTAGMWLHEPGTDAVGGASGDAAAQGGGVAGWWIAVAVVTVGVGVAAIVLWRRRIVRPITREEDAMQTLERTEERTASERVAELTRHRRVLTITLAVVIVSGAMAIGWLIAENRGLSSDLDAAVWPAESELTQGQQAILGLVGPDGAFFDAWNAGDFETFYGLHSEAAIVVDPGFGVYPVLEPAGRNLLGMWHSQGYDDLVPERVWVFEEDAVVFVDSATTLPGPQVFFFDLTVTGDDAVIDMFATQFAPRR